MELSLCKSTVTEAMEKHLMDIQKINFDLGVLTINEPERAAKIMANIKGTGNLEYLGKHAMPLLIALDVTPKVPRNIGLTRGEHRGSRHQFYRRGLWVHVQTYYGWGPLPF